MKAVVFHAVGDIRFEDAADPTIEEPTDAVVRSTGPTDVLTQVEPLGSVIEAHESFDLREPGWIKVELKAA